MSNEIVLKVNNQSYTGWKNVAIRKSLTQLCGTFGFEYTDKFSGNPNKWKIKMGLPCTVEINDQLIITGWIEDMPISYDHSQHTIQVSGRDNTCDLVDCSFVGQAREWKGQTIKAIVKMLCSPFGIKAVVDNNVRDEGESVPISADALISTFKVKEGDSVFEAIKKLCLTKALLPVSYGDGKLTITRAGSSRCTDALVLGKNILKGGLNQSNKDRFSKYICKGTGIGDDYMDTLDFLKTKREAIDEVMAASRYRPIVITYDGIASKRRCLDRACWEARMRAGKSRSLVYLVQGWTQSDGKVWALNSLVSVKDDLFGIRDEFLITDVEYILSQDQGTFTRMVLMDPEVFELLETSIKAIKFPFDLREEDSDVPYSQVAVGGVSSE